MGILQRLLQMLTGGGSAPTQTYNFAAPNSGYSGNSYAGGHAYNRITNMLGTSGMSEADVRAQLASKYFSEADINKLCATPSFRQLMGWG